MDAKHMTKAQLSAEVTHLRKQNGTLSEENRRLRAKLARRKPVSRQLSLSAPSTPTTHRSLQ